MERLLIITKLLPFICIPLLLNSFWQLRSFWLSSRKHNITDLFAIGLVSFLVIGIFVYCFAYDLTFDVPLHDYYFVIGVFHLYIMFVVVFGMFMVLSQLFVLLAGQQMNQTLGKIHFWITFVGSHCILSSLLFMCISLPKPDVSAENEWYNNLNIAILVAILFVFIAQVLFLVNLMYSILRRLSIPK